MSQSLVNHAEGEAWSVSANGARAGVLRLGPGMEGREKQGPGGGGQGK